MWRSAVARPARGAVPLEQPPPVEAPARADVPGDTGRSGQPEPSLLPSLRRWFLLAGLALLGSSAVHFYAGAYWLSGWIAVGAIAIFTGYVDAIDD